MNILEGFIAKATDGAWRHQYLLAPEIHCCCPLPPIGAVRSLTQLTKSGNWEKVPV